jgi:mannose/cellobiose epimerase-like protein (N-acyl-D-glucosamine 2-epimerase family)
LAPTLTELLAGHSFEAMSIVMDAARCRAYRDATGDALDVYDAQSAVAPLAVAAFALGALLESVGLPPGTLHANESLRARRAVPVGSTVECRSRVAQRSQRGGWIVTVLESDALLDGESAVFSRATVLCPTEQP